MHASTAYMIETKVTRDVDQENSWEERWMQYIVKLGVLLVRNEGPKLLGIINEDFVVISFKFKEKLAFAYS